MSIPTQKECYQLIREMGMLDHIVVHSEQVCRVAVLLTDHLNQKGFNLDADLITAAALLHDITKTRSFRTHENHAQTGGAFLEQKGFIEVGRIVSQHVKLDAYFLSDKPIEAEIVNYSDKRVLHDQIVSLSDRMNYILDRYGNGEENRERIFMLWSKTKELEEKLFSFLPFTPDSLKHLCRE